jgi:hypothetical protein
MAMACCLRPTSEREQISPTLLQKSSNPCQTGLDLGWKIREMTFLIIFDVGKDGIYFHISYPEVQEQIYGIIFLH